MFAGPNGSGKSTIKEVIPPNLLGVYLNADDIEKQIRLNSWFDLSDYVTNVPAIDLIAYFKASSFLTTAGLQDQVQNIGLDAHKLDFSRITMNSYFASVLVDFLRRHLVKQKVSFTFETVMSAKDKVDFLKLAQECGYRTYLYFVATVDPEINISRVQSRVKMGGHPVDPAKIVKRYYLSLDNLMDAIGYANRAYVFDNSIGDDSVLLAEITNGEELELKVDAIPAWFKTYVMDKFTVG